MVVGSAPVKRISIKSTEDNTLYTGGQSTFRNKSKNSLSSQFVLLGLVVYLVPYRECMSRQSVPTIVETEEGIISGFSGPGGLEGSRVG